MTVLKSLTLAALPKNGNNPALNRRTTTIARLEEQKRLLADPSYVRVTQRWTRKDGEKIQTEKRQKVSPWWRLDQSGGYLFLVRSGGKPIEFDKGKSAVAVPSLDKLPPVIDTLIAAVRSGELDDQMAQVSKQRTVPKSRKP